MKKYKWLIVTVCVLLVLAVGAYGVISFLDHRAVGISTGRCLVSAHGDYLLIEGNSPTVMSDRSAGGNLFGDLTSGDEILVIHDLILETYPGQTGAYFCWKLSDGDISDISQTLITDLKTMGWLS